MNTDQIQLLRLLVEWTIIELKTNRYKVGDKQKIVWTLTEILEELQ